MTLITLKRGVLGHISQASITCHCFDGQVGDGRCFWLAATRIRYAMPEVDYGGAPAGVTPACLPRASRQHAAYGDA